MQTMTPEFLQQLLLAMDLAERSEHQGSDYEESTFEQGVASALQWVAGMVSCPPLDPAEYPDLTVSLISAARYLRPGHGADERGGRE